MLCLSGLGVESGAEIATFSVQALLEADTASSMYLYIVSNLIHGKDFLIQILPNRL